MFLVGVELVKFARHLRPGRDLIVLGATVAIALVGNMAYGCAGGMAVHEILKRFPTRGDGPEG